MTPTLTTSTTGAFAPTPDERTHWEEQGFLIRERVFSPDECDDLSARAERLARDESAVPEMRRRENALTKQQAQDDGEAKTEKVMHSVTRPHIYDERFRAHIRDPRLTDVLAAILSPNLLTHNTLFIFKAPGVGLPFPWHQDMWFFRTRFQTPFTVGVWQAMDDAYVANGSMWVIPGSHKWPVLEHDLPTDGPQQQEFRLARLPDPEETGVAVEIPKGSVLWFHSSLLHRSGHNNTESWRRTFVTHYLPAEATYTRGENDRGEPIAWVRGETSPGHVQAEGDDTILQTDIRWAETAAATAAAQAATAQTPPKM